MNPLFPRRRAARRRSAPRPIRGLGMLCLALGATGCGSGPPSGPPAQDAEPPPTPRLAEVAAAAGVRWRHHPYRTGRKLLPETYGGGGGFLDYDGDGRLDLLLLDGAPLPGFHGPAPRHALYRNDGSGRFTDVTRAAGLSFDQYGMGAATGDFDGDGWTDLFLTAVGKTRLLRNHRGRFVDVTAHAGAAVRGWTTGAAWLDFDADGVLDLFVARYVKWSPATDLPCGSERSRQYCPPYQYRAAPPVLLRGRGDGTFSDVSAHAGILGHAGKTLAVLPCDPNGDGRTDLYLANDTEPDVLLLNQADGTFRDEALAAGTAVGTDGRATGSMGVDAGTPFADGRRCIAVGNFVNQGMSLFAPLPGDPAPVPLFENLKVAAGVFEPTRSMSTFGLVFADVELDGWPDLVLLNGHLDENLAIGERREPYRQRPQLLQNRRDGTFRDTAAAAGIAQPLVGRGLAAGDFDDDGRVDFLAFENGGPVRLWHNESPAGSWLGLRLRGTRSARDGAGATVTASGAGWSHVVHHTTARSYLAACDPRVLIGLGRRLLHRVTIRWPRGTVDELRRPPTGRYLRVEEGRGLIAD